jgi:hypothetical protein
MVLLTSSRCSCGMRAGNVAKGNRGATGFLRNLSGGERGCHGRIRIVVQDLGMAADASKPT